MNEIETILQILSPLGSAGILAWYLYYKTTVSDPERDRQNYERISLLSKEHADSIERICKDFTNTLKEERESCRERTQILQDEIRHLRGLMDTKHGS